VRDTLLPAFRSCRCVRKKQVLTAKSSDATQMNSRGRFTVQCTGQCTVNVPSLIGLNLEPRTRCEPADHAQCGQVHPALWLLEQGAGAQDVGVGKSKQPISAGSWASTVTQYLFLS
jgi:hypothetical protein